ncbi:substrate-binding domain-containing protein [Paucibacter sp. R3-3]|uniref:Substrate-binding domain-containing protein n=1 Tax=Roseateles agri TaxID=3098619 RepID=A0ABU5DQN2_9BURK|nr:substrate-binding domain-containing protein [Paucibacter sp. R3-3]MDY0748631.1 substrate-binding domain-containing protein [Paucibacter sp. R3-3]
MPTDLKQLAALLKLSPTTVSRALNGYSDVSEATRQRVAEAAKAAGYEPSPAARRLAIGRADAVGIVYPVEADFMGNPLFLEMIGGVSDRLDGAGYDVLLAVARKKTELRTYERLVRGRRVDGLIVAHTRVKDERIDFLRGTQMPFIGYGRTSECDDFPWLDFDNEACTRLAMNELTARGHRRIAYIHSPLNLNFAQQRYDGYLKAMAAAGLVVNPEHVLTGGHDRRGGYEATKRLLALADTRPTAILVDSNLCGVGTVRALLQAGIAIGTEMSVIVIDGLPVDTPLYDQDIAAIAQPTAHASGWTMADMLLKLIEGKPLDEPRVLKQPQFVNGRSLGLAPT